MFIREPGSYVDPSIKVDNDGRTSSNPAIFMELSVIVPPEVDCDMAVELSYRFKALSSMVGMLMPQRPSMDCSILTAETARRLTRLTIVKFCIANVV